MCTANNYSNLILFISQFIYDFLNLIAFFGLNMFIEILTVIKLKNELKEKEERAKRFNQSDLVREEERENSKKRKLEEENKKSERKAIIMITSSSILNFFLRLPEESNFILTSYSLYNQIFYEDKNNQLFYEGKNNSNNYFFIFGYIYGLLFSIISIAL